MERGAVRGRRPNKLSYPGFAPLTQATLLRQTLVEYCPDIHSLSVDLRDMDPVAYKKRLKG